MTTTVIAIPRSTFPLGRTVITANAEATLDPSQVLDALRRHASGDWGDLCREDARRNACALENGGRLFSVYGQGTRRFWIISESDRSVTTVLMPLDY